MSRIKNGFYVLLFIGVIVMGCEQLGANTEADLTLQQGLDEHYPAGNAASSLVLYGTNSSSDGLFTINAETGETTFIGPLDPDPSLYVSPVSMATRPSDGRIFIWNNSNLDPVTGLGITTGVLLVADPCTGLATPLDPSTPDQPLAGGSMAFDPIDKRLLGILPLREFDQETGLITFLSSASLNISGADVNAQGHLYGLELGSLGSERLIYVDKTTGEHTIIGTLSVDVGTVGSIVFSPAGTLIGSASNGPLGSILFDINTTTAEVTNIRSMLGEVSAQGMGFAPACEIAPEIDILPGISPNVIDITSERRITVALLTHSGFDATTVTLPSITLGNDDAQDPHVLQNRNNVYLSQIKDVDQDGDADLVVTFSIELLRQRGDLDTSTTELILNGITNDGRSIRAADTIVVE